MKTTFQTHLATILSALQLYQIKKENTIVDEAFEKKVLEQKVHWERYFQEAKKQLTTSTRTFKKYDHKNLLGPFFKKIKFCDPQKITYEQKHYEILFPYALEAFNNQRWNDAYAMFYFIVSYFPIYPKAYLFLGKATEEIKGLEQASEFYKTTCDVLNDPELYFFAAECEIKRNNLDNCKKYLLKVKELFNNRSSLSASDQELLSETNSTLELINQEL